AMMLLLFAVNTLGQVSGPTEQTVVPLVASDNQLASAASLIGLASAVGTAFGAALLAPVLLRLFGVTVVLYAAGIFLLVAATRVIDLSAGDKHHFRPRVVVFAPRCARPRRCGGWRPSRRSRAWSSLPSWQARPRSSCRLWPPATCRPRSEWTPRTPC